jgi:hypothetical protein
MKISETVKLKDVFIMTATGFAVFFYIFLTSHLVGFVRDEGMA